MSDPPLWSTAAAAALLLLLAACVPASAAPMHDPQQVQHQLDEYYGGSTATGCYYNFVHYEEGDRIMTNEPCLNCTCHNRMLMCYLRVCPFSKGIGQDCTVEQKPDQCCPVITCPEVPVQLITSSTTITTPPAPTGSTAVGHPDNYGCTIDEVFYSDGTKIPGDPTKPCELCYCIRNHTACVMQECTLHVEGCRPVYAEGVCCPVRYDCDYQEYTTSAPLLETTVRPTPGLLFTTTMAGPLDCRYGEETYADGALIETEEPCQHCYCMRGDIVCAVQECGTPLEREAGNCTALPPQPGQCCPQQYQCDNGTVPFDILSQEIETAQTSKSTASGVTGSTKSDEQLSLSTEATVVQQSNIDKEEDAQQQGNLDETQEHLNEVEQGLEQHTHYDDEEIEKGTEIEHVTVPAEHEGQGMIEQFTQSVEHLPGHPADDSGHITLESESSVTEAVIASSEKQRTTLEGAETATESVTSDNVASISEDIETIEQVTQQELTPSSIENGNQDEHDEQTLTAEVDNHPSADQTTSSGEPASSSGISELPNVQDTTEQNVPELVTLKDEIDFTHKSTSATQNPSDTDEESVPVTHEIITGESDSTEKLEQQDLMPSSPQSSPTNEFITPAVEIQPSTDKTEESASSENIPEAIEPLEAEEAESHVTETQIHEDEHTVAAPVRTSTAETSGITMPVQGIEQEIVTEGLQQTTFESANKVTDTESTEEHVTSGSILESSTAVDKFDEEPHEQSVTEANIAEEVGHTSDEAPSEMHEAEQQTSDRPPQLPMDEVASISQEIESSTGAESIHHTTSKSDSTGFVSELTTSASSDKQEESSSQATETLLSEDNDNELDSTTKVDETEQATLFDDISSSSESGINAEKRPEETGSVGDLPHDTDTSLNEVLTTVQPSVPVTSITQESSNLLPGEGVGKPSESGGGSSGDITDESEASAEVEGSIDTVTTKVETTEEDINEQPVTAPAELKPSASTGKTDEGLLITHPPETAEPSASNEVSVEASGDSTEESVHHLVSEMNGKPTEIHTTPSESALSSQSSHEVTNGIPEESQQGGFGATEPAPPKEPILVDQSTESELSEQESSQKPAFGEDAEVVTSGSIPSETHETESAPQETKAPHEAESSSEAKPESSNEVTTEQASVSEGLQQEAVEQQVIHEVTENVIVEQSSGGSSVVSTPGFDEIEHEVSQQQTQKSTEAGGNQYTTEISAHEISGTATEQPTQKPVEDGGLPPVEGSAVTLETVTPPHDVPLYHETQESAESDKLPSEIPLTTSGVGGFVHDLSTTTSMLGPVGIPTSVPPHALIPGEGSCLVDGKTYANNSEIPPPNHCHVSCHCMSSIVHCVTVNCPPPPTHLKNCTPVRHSDDACCPTYTCDVEHKVTLVADSMVAATGRPTVSSETSAAPIEDHQDDVKPQITDGSPSLNTDEDSNVVTEVHPVYHDTETEEQENAGDSVHDTQVTDKPQTVSSQQEEQMPASPEPSEAQEGHTPSSEKPADEQVVQQEENDQQGTEVQQTVHPVEEEVAEEHAPSEVKPEGTEAVIQEGADTLEHTGSPSESSVTLSDKNENQVTTEKVSAENEHVPTIASVGISETKDHTYSSTSTAEDATTVLMEHLPASSDEMLSTGTPSTAADDERPQQPVEAVTEHSDSLASSVTDEQHFTVSADHVTAAVEESAHEEQSSHVSSTDQTDVSSPQMEVTDAESVPNGQSPSQSIPDEKLPPAETVTDDQQIVSIIHSDVPTVAPPESDSQSKYPTASSEQEKPQEFLNTGKPEISSSRPESYETITSSFSNDDTQQATTSVIHHLPSEKPSDHQQETEQQTDFPIVTGFEEAVSPQQAEDVITEEGSGHEEPVDSIVTEAAELEQSPSHPVDMEEHQQTVSQGSLLPEEETTVQSESETQQSSVSVEHIPPVQPVEEEHGEMEASTVQTETNKPESDYQPLPEQDTIHPGGMQTISPIESDSQQSYVPEYHPFDSDLPTTQEQEQFSPSFEAITEHLPQQPTIHEGEAESSEQTVTVPSSNKEDSTIIQDSIVTEQEKQTEKLPEEMQTVSPIDNINPQESSSQKPVEQLSDTEETTEQQTLATVTASQQPDTVMQEEVTDKISDDKQTSAPIETDSQQVAGSYPHDFNEGSGGMETQEIQTSSPVVIEEESSTISQESALPGGEAVSDAETEQEQLPSEEEKESVTSQQPIQAVSQQETVFEDKTADSITESYVEQQTSLQGEVNSEQDITSQEHVVDEEHEQTTFAAENQFEQTPSPFQPGTADLAEHEVTTTSASDTQTFVSGEPIISEEQQPDQQQTLLPSEEDNQHVSVPEQQSPITEEMPFQTSSPVYEDKESSASIVTVSEDKTPGISEETNKQTAHPLEDDVQHPVTSQEGAPVTESAEQQTRFTAQDEMVHSENMHKPSQDSQQVTEILGHSDTVTNLPVEADSEQFLTGEGGIEKVTGSVEGQTTSPIDSENEPTAIPSHPATGEEVSQTVSSSDEEQGFPSVMPDVEQTHHESQGGHEMTVTETLHEESTSGPEQPEISATLTIPVAGMDGDTQITNIPEEHVPSAAEANDDEAGEMNADTQTVASQEPQSPVETVSTAQESEELHPSTPEEIYVQQVTTTPKPETSSDKTAELEGSEIQQSSLPSETGIQETSTVGEQEASVIEDTEPQQTISPIESGAQTADVSQPVSAPDMEQEPAFPPEPEIQQAANTEESIPAEGDSSSVGETSTETATSAVDLPAPSKEEQPSPAEPVEQTARPIESDVQEAIVTESISSDKDTSISFSKPADSVSQSTVTPDEHHEVETIVSTHVPEDLESQSGSTNAPDVHHSEHETTSGFTQPNVVQESGSVTLGIANPSQAPIESADHHIEISEQSSQGTVTEETVVQHDVSHTTSASVKPVVPEDEEEQVANNVHPVEVSEGNHILTASSEYPQHTTAQPVLVSSDHSDANQATAVQENELEVNASSTVHPDQKPAHSSTSHPAYEHFPEDHTLAAGEGIEHITEATKRPSHHFTTRPPFTTASHHHPSQHPEDQYEQFPFGEGQYPTGVDTDYDDEEQAAFGPGTCRYGGKVYVSAQQIPRDDPCDFCFCFRSDIICLQQSCPPPIPGCHEEPIQGFCCPRYECPVSMATVLNVSTTTTTTTTTLPPHFLAHHYRGAAHRTGCQVQGSAYRVGEVVHSASGPCLECRCGGDGQMKCDPKECSPEPMLRKMIMAAASRRR